MLRSWSVPRSPDRVIVCVRFRNDLRGLEKVDRRPFSPYDVPRSWSVPRSTDGTIVCVSFRTTRGVSSRSVDDLPLHMMCRDHDRFWDCPTGPCLCEVSEQPAEGPELYKVLERLVNGSKCVLNPKMTRKGLDVNCVHTYFYKLSQRVMNLSEIRTKYGIDFWVKINGSLSPTPIPHHNSFTGIIPRVCLASYFWILLHRQYCLRGAFTLRTTMIWSSSSFFY